MRWTFGGAWGCSLAGVMVVGCLLGGVAKGQAASGPATQAVTAERRAAAERKAEQSWSDLATAVKQDPQFADKATRDAMRKLLPALLEERSANPDRPAALERYSQRLAELMKLVGIDPKFPFPMRTPDDVDTVMAFAVKHPFFAGDSSLKPGTPRYEDLKKNLPDLLAMQVAQTVKWLAVDDEDLAGLQKRMAAAPALATEDASSRVALTTTMLKLLREGRMPK